MMKLSRGPLHQVDSCNRIWALADRGRARVGLPKRVNRGCRRLSGRCKPPSLFSRQLASVDQRVIMLATKTSNMCVSWPAADILGAASKFPRFNVQSSTFQLACRRHSVDCL